MTDREKMWRALSDRAEMDEAVAKALDDVRQAEQGLADQQYELDASNVKLPYGSSDDEMRVIWK